MNLIDEVLLFSRDYINNKTGRTKEHKVKIKEALRQLTGEKFNFGCSTCYIEALFKILNLTKMATPKGYELKRGVLLEAFGDSSKTCTNDTLTDELGDWYMKHYPEKAIYFSKIPAIIPEQVFAPIPKEVKIEPSSADKLTEGVPNKTEGKKVVKRISKVKK